MAKYLDKWKDLFPETVGGTTRPSEAVSDQEEFNTDGFPQFIAQDPVNYALQNAFLKQFLSNDAWLWVKQQQANQALDDHKVDTQAHAKGISGNAASATNADEVDGYHASDIIGQITAANTGGIVAAALDTNGYVKFANGLTVQWGYLGTTHNGNTKVTFPISFKTIFNLVCDMIGLCTSSGDNGSLNIQSYNTTGASFFNTDDRDGTGLFWIAVGIV